MEKILTRYLSPYVFGLEKENLTFGLLSGELKLNEVFVKREVSELFDLPVTVEYGRVGSLTLKVPWGKWFSTSFNMTVTASDIILFVSPRKYHGEGNVEEMAAQVIKQLRMSKLKVSGEFSAYMISAIKTSRNSGCRFMEATRRPCWFYRSWRIIDKFPIFHCTYAAENHSRGFF